MQIFIYKNEIYLIVLKKIITLGIIIILSFTIFAGCTVKNSDNLPELDTYNFVSTKIIAPEKAYFDEEISFESIDNKKINSYIWDFGDGNILEGNKVSYKYFFKDEFETKFPLIYTVQMFIKKDGYIIGGAVHQLKLYPKNFVFYFKSEDDKNKETSYLIEDTFDKNNKIFNLQNPVKIPASDFNIVLNIQKPIIVNLNKIQISFINLDDQVVFEQEKFIGFFNFWNKKTISITGCINEDIMLKNIQISFNNQIFSEKINIIDDERSKSKITFNFEDNDFKDLYI